MDKEIQRLLDKQKTLTNQITLELVNIARGKTKLHLSKWQKKIQNEKRN